MNIISPATKEAYGLLRNEIYVHLEGAEYLAQEFRWDAREQDMARKVIPDLVTIIRGMMIQHEATENGKCRICRLSWPCSITETIHALVTDPDRTFCEILDSARDA